MKIVLIALIFQVLFFVQAIRSISLYKKILPDISNLSVLKLILNDDIFKQKTPSEIQRLFCQPSDATGTTSHMFEEVGVKQETAVELSLLQSQGASLEFLSSQLMINDYIIRHKGRLLDSGFIQNLIDRRLQVQKDRVLFFLQMPLYLGILATLTTLLFANQISAEVIKIALSSSFFGAILFLWGNELIYKKASFLVDEKLINFNLFVQTELLFKSYQDFAVSVGSLQEMIGKFKTHFLMGSDRVVVALEQNAVLIRSQLKMIEVLDRGYLVSITKHSLEILKGLQESIHCIEAFNRRTVGLEELLDKAQVATNGLNGLLDKFKMLERYAKSFDQIVANNQQVMHFLSENIVYMQERKNEMHHQLVKHENHTTDLFRGLLEHIQETSVSIREFTSKEYQAIQDVLSSDRQVFDQLKELSEIKELLSRHLESSHQKT